MQMQGQAGTCCFVVVSVAARTAPTAGLGVLGVGGGGRGGGGGLSERLCGQVRAGAAVVDCLTLSGVMN